MATDTAEKLFSDLVEDLDLDKVPVCEIGDCDGTATWLGRLVSIVANVSFLACDVCHNDLTDGIHLFAYHGSVFPHSRITWTAL